MILSDRDIQKAIEAGKIELEIVNHGPFAIKFFPRKTSIAQVLFERVSSLPTTGGKSVHQHQK